MVSAWSEADHPRVPAGQPGGGEFAGGNSGKESPRPKADAFRTDPKTTTRDLNAVKAAINAIPEKHAAEIAQVPVTLKAEVSTFGSKLGDNASAKGMFHWDGSPRIQIAQGVPFKGTLMHFQNIEGTTVHELGHALDHARGWSMSNNSEFMRLNREEMSNLSAKEKSNGAYWISDRKEMFAELYSLAHNPRVTGTARYFGGMSKARAEKVFASSLAWVRSQ